MKEFMILITAMYLTISVTGWMIRSAEDDCKVRYMDYVFPITRLSCEVGGSK